MTVASRSMQVFQNYPMRLEVFIVSFHNNVSEELIF